MNRLSRTQLSLACVPAKKRLFSHHLKHLVVHGFLHLLGFDHEDEKEAQEMESLEIEILKSLSIPNPYKKD